MYAARARNGGHELKLALRASGYTGAGPVENFPALVRLSEGVRGFSYKYLSDEGATSGDIHFQDAAGNELPFEVDCWDPEGESTIWVRMPVLSRSAKTILVYGVPYSPAGDAAALRASVWSGMTGVWHVNYGVEGSVEEKGYYANSAQNPVSTFRAWDKNVVGTEDGAVGKARWISRDAAGGSGRFIRASKNDVMAGLGSTFTASIWFKYKMTGQGVGDDRLFSHKRNGEYNVEGWEVNLNKSNAKLLEVRGGGGATYQKELFPDGANSGDWYNVVTIFDGTKLTVYINGEFADEETGKISAADNSKDWSLTFGCSNHENGNYSSFKGILDEIRLGVGSLSADRIRADYETVAKPDFFSASQYAPGFTVLLR